MQRLTVSGRLAMLAGVSVAGLAVAIGMVIFETWQVREHARSAEALMAIAVVSGDAIHALQAERGNSVGFIQSKGAKFANELPKQRAASDEALRALNGALDSAPAAKASLGGELQVLSRQLADLAATRDAVSGLKISPPEAAAYYTRVIAASLQIVNAANRANQDPAVGRKISALFALMNGKEWAGQERALVTKILAADRMDAADLREFLGKLHRQDTYFGVFRDSAAPEEAENLRAALAKTSAQEVEKVRKAVLDKGAEGGIGVEPEAWWTQSSDRIDAIHEVARSVAANGTDLARTQFASSTRQLAGYAAFALAMVMLTLWNAFRTTRSITRPLNDAVDSANRLAQGNLSIAVAEHGNDEIGRLLAAMKHMAGELTRIISEVRSSADSLVESSNQVSSTAQSISQAASEQAASVEETSASIEQMNASIVQNTENAKVTDGMAANAAKEAAEGGAAVGETVEAMKSIAEKVRIVDDIAYQTNLLALNAAIEAARAGEHGKGFAVVASEVRKLAERSQVAAKEIGELASSSVHRAEKAGKLLETIVPSITKTSDLVQEIAAASEEQSTGVTQVNGAISQLNQATQQNASASEELAATAEEMNGQAEQLRQLVGFFKLDAASAAGAGPSLRARPALAKLAAPGEDRDFRRF